MALPGAGRRRGRETVGVVLVEEALEQQPTVLLKLRVLVTEPDVHAVCRLGEHPTVEGGDHGIEDHVDHPGLVRDVVPPPHDGLKVAPRTTVEREPALRAVGHHSELGLDRLAVGGLEADHPIIAGEEVLHLHARPEFGAERLRAAEEELVEDAAVADHGRIGLADHADVVPGRGDEPHAVDGQRLRRDGIEQVERLEDLDALGRDRASARLVAWKIVPVHDDHVADAQPTQLDGGRKPCRT